MRGFRHYADGEVVGVTRRPGRPRARARGADRYRKFLSDKYALFSQIPGIPGLHHTQSLGQRRASTGIYVKTRRAGARPRVIPIWGT